MCLKPDQGDLSLSLAFSFCALNPTNWEASKRIHVLIFSCSTFSEYAVHSLFEATSATLSSASESSYTHVRSRKSMFHKVGRLVLNNSLTSSDTSFFTSYLVVYVGISREREWLSQAYKFQPLNYHHVNKTPFLQFPFVFQTRSRCADKFLWHSSHLT